jgi:hypothetical protein
MPTETYTALATVTLGSSASSVTFSSIPATYRDLVLISVPVDTAIGTSQSLFVRFNSDSGSNYPFVYMGTDTSGTPLAGAATLTAIVAARYDNRQDGMGICRIMDYSATDKHKTTLTTGGMGNRTVSGITTLQAASRWANTSAITSLFIFSELSGNFAAGSRFDLYGIAS